MRYFVLFEGRYLLTGWSSKHYLEVASARGIPVLYTPFRNAPAVADYTLGLMIAGSRIIYEAHYWLKYEGIWDTGFYTYTRADPELSERML